VLPLKEATVTEDDDVEFSCELSKAEAVVKWLKDGVEIAASEHVSFETAGTKRTLKIRKTTVDDAASYQCQIVASGQSCQAPLTVNGLYVYSLECGKMLL